MYHNLEDCLSVAKTDDGKFVISYQEKQKEKETKKDNGKDNQGISPCKPVETKTEVASTIDEVLLKIKEHLKGGMADKKKRDDNYDEEL